MHCIQTKNTTSFNFFFFFFYSKRHSKGWPHPPAYGTEDRSASWRPFQYHIPLLNFINQGIQPQQFASFRFQFYITRIMQIFNPINPYTHYDPIGYAATQYSFPWIHIHYVICLLLTNNVACSSIRVTQNTFCFSVAIASMA